MKKVVFFTNSFPFGIKEEWKYSQLVALAEKFEDVLVVPLQYGCSRIRSHLPSGVRVCGPLFEREGVQFKRRDLLRLVNSRLPGHLKALLTGLSASEIRVAFRKWAIDALKIERILSDHKILPMLFNEMEGAVLYFFWGKGWADILPFLREHLKRRSVVRFHGFDLYRERAGNYIPYQKEIVYSASLLLTVSRSGVQYIHNEYPDCASKTIYSPLGTQAKGRAVPSNDGSFRLVSCAFVLGVKRLDLIARALPYLHESVTWTHIGDGPGLDSLKALAETLGVEHRIRFLGHVPSTEVNSVYSDNSFDLFLNVSKSEGLPVSIMEALGAGIPVLATDVGGNGEIVDQSVGELMQKDLSAETLAQHIKTFMGRSRNDHLLIRDCAVDRQQQNFDALRNARVAAEFVGKL